MADQNEQQVLQFLTSSEEPQNLADIIEFTQLEKNEVLRSLNKLGSKKKCFKHPDGYSTTPADTAPALETKTNQPTLEDKILTYMASSSKLVFTGNVADALQMDKNHVSAKMRALRDRGFLHNKTNGVYFISTKGIEKARLINPSINVDKKISGRALIQEQGETVAEGNQEVPTLCTLHKQPANNESHINSLDAELQKLESDLSPKLPVNCPNIDDKIKVVALFVRKTSGNVQKELKELEQYLQQLKAG